MSLEIIPAQKKHALASAELILDAMEELIYFYLGEENKPKALRFLTDQFLLEDSLYSYKHTQIAILREKLVGVIIAYDSSKHQRLQQILKNYLEENYNFKDDLTPETEAGEFYVDAISINPSFRGQKIGSELLQHAEKLALKQKHSQIGLLVDLENPNAKRLYERIGYQVVKSTSLGKHAYEHLQKQLYK